MGIDPELFELPGDKLELDYNTVGMAAGMILRYFICKVMGA